MILGKRLTLVLKKKSIVKKKSTRLFTFPAKHNRTEKCLIESCIFSEISTKQMTIFFISEHGPACCHRKTSKVIGKTLENFMKVNYFIVCFFVILIKLQSNRPKEIAVYHYFSELRFGSNQTCILFAIFLLSLFRCMSFIAYL